MSNIISLKKVIYDERARNGVWCKTPYPNHPKGCPNFPDCPKKHPDFNSLKGYSWIAVIEEFDLATWAEKREEVHRNRHFKEYDDPTQAEFEYIPLSDRQRRNVLYWQNGVMSRLRKKAYKYANRLGDIVLEIPEACGVNVFETMSKVGVIFQRSHPNYILKTMLIGRQKEGIE